MNIKKFNRPILTDVSSSYAKAELLATRVMDGSRRAIGGRDPKTRSPVFIQAIASKCKRENDLRKAKIRRKHNEAVQSVDLMAATRPLKRPGAQ